MPRFLLDRLYAEIKDAKYNVAACAAGLEAVCKYPPLKRAAT